METMASYGATCVRIPRVTRIRHKSEPLPDKTLKQLGEDGPLIPQTTSKEKATAPEPPDTEDKAAAPEPPDIEEKAESSQTTGVEKAAAAPDKTLQQQQQQDTPDASPTEIRGTATGADVDPLNPAPQHHHGHPHDPGHFYKEGAGDGESSSDFWFAEHISSPSTADSDPATDDPHFWGPYLSERQWATVREDYSVDDNSWEHVTYEDAVSHVYVSGEDGLLGFSDRCANLCMSVALWNEKDTMLKERLFGLTGTEGNHGEDVKELYYYLDSLPDHSYMRALYKYPHLAFPYTRLREENKNRGVEGLELELTDTGIFEEGGHWDVQVEYAKTDRLGLACLLEVTNCGRHEETLHLVPQFWFRHLQENEPIPEMPEGTKPLMEASSDGSVRITYHFGQWRLVFLPDPSRDSPTLLFTDNQSHAQMERQSHQSPLFTKEAFHQYIVKGKDDAVNPERVGTKCGAYYKLRVAAGNKASVYWRMENVLNPLQMSSQDLVNHFANKRQEASQFYTEIMPKWSTEERNIGIQALAGLMWSKQYYCFDIKAWLHDPRRCRHDKENKGRNQDWTHISNHHILMMPDNWEFPWYAGWDLCISAVLCARYDLEFAKQQMLTFLSEDYMHPRGQLPGCEFDLGDPNPPLQAWAILQIFYKDGAHDLEFLKTCYNRLVFNYTWWCGKEFPATSTYGHGFLGMDNISVINRSNQVNGLPLVQADATGWMACFALWMLKIVMELAKTDKVYCDLIKRYLGHFVNIASALNRSPKEEGLWVEEDGFVYDVFRIPNDPLPVRLRSMAGLVPLLACGTIDMKNNPTAVDIMRPYMDKYQDHLCWMNDSEVFLSVLSMPQVQSVLDRVFNEEEFLGPYGIRSLSKVHEQGYDLNLKWENEMVGEHVRYLPGESHSGAFGGNSNWRGPVWVFMNHLLLESMDTWMHRLSATKCQASGVWLDLPDLMTDLEKRLLNIFLPDEEGKRPVHGDVTRYAEDPKWRHLVLFYEFMHADTGRGCGASHQTGWTASIIEIIHRLHSKP